MTQKNKQYYRHLYPYGNSKIPRGYDRSSWGNQPMSAMAINECPVCSMWKLKDSKLCSNCRYDMENNNNDEEDIQEKAETDDSQ
jgi:hypothetical protein